MSTALDPRRAFSLLELLVVLGVIALLLAIVPAAGLRPRDGFQLAAAEHEIVRTAHAARLRAITRGRSVRLLIQADPNAPRASTRFRRALAVQEQGSDGLWRTVDCSTLPRGTGVLPHGARLTADMLDGPAPAEISSSALSAAQVVDAIDTEAPEAWDVIRFGASGQTMQNGRLVIGRTRAPLGGALPLVFAAPLRGVRTLQLTTHGLVFPSSAKPPQ